MVLFVPQGLRCVNHQEAGERRLSRWEVVGKTSAQEALKVWQRRHGHLPTFRLCAVHDAECYILRPLGGVPLWETAIRLVVVYKQTKIKTRHRVCCCRSWSPEDRQSQSTLTVTFRDFCSQLVKKKFQLWPYSAWAAWSKTTSGRGTLEYSWYNKGTIL